MAHANNNPRSLITDFAIRSPDGRKIKLASGKNSIFLIVSAAEQANWVHDMRFPTM